MTSKMRKLRANAVMWLVVGFWAAILLGPLFYLIGFWVSVAVAGIMLFLAFLLLGSCMLVEWALGELG